MSSGVGQPLARLDQLGGLGVAALRCHGLGEERGRRAEQVGRAHPPRARRRRAGSAARPLAGFPARSSTAPASSDVEAASMLFPSSSSVVRACRACALARVRSRPRIASRCASAPSTSPTVRLVAGRLGHDPRALHDRQRHRRRAVDRGDGERRGVAALLAEVAGGAGVRRRPRNGRRRLPVAKRRGVHGAQHSPRLGEAGSVVEELEDRDARQCAIRSARSDHSGRGSA